MPYRTAARDGCPRCHDALVIGDDGRGSCASCSGQWIPVAVVATLELGASAADLMPPDGGPEGDLACPQCRRPMLQKRVGALTVLDGCPAHGIWCDARELARVIAEFEAQAPTRDLFRPSPAANVGAFRRLLRALTG